MMDERPIRLELYSRPGCHLCDDLRSLCERLRGEFSLRLGVLNIEADPELLARYDQEVPVLFIDGRKAVKFRTTEAALRRMLQRRRLVKRLFGL
ncbi:MAG TPA: glutaredoxin family protein [Candidatus Methylomirabilis sp.]|nr:glutaredoxin family protein [Candidatus Methylomirabilis sp.]